MDEPTPIKEQQYLWDEEQKLMAVNDRNTGIHHYTYDHNGERIMKTSLRQVGGALDGQSHNSYVMDPSIVYVNPYFVATHYSETVEASKHYYMGSQRVASALIGYPFVAETPIDDPVGDPGDPPAGLVAGGGTEIGPVVNLLHVLDLYGKVEGVDYDTEIMMEMHGIGVYDTESAFMEASEHCNEEPACLCEHSRYWANIVYDVDCDDYNVMYWYHPDYLGNTEYVTDLAGEPYEYFWYSPWGEPLIEKHSLQGSFYSPYLFNAKELDAETGNYYYGARYYNPKTSIWLSVDPMASEAPSWTPYRFCFDNPVNVIDPTGLFENLDDITVNSEGVITKVVETDEPHRFFDENGNELFLNDPENADSHLKNGTFMEGEQLFFNVPVKEYAEVIQDAGINVDAGIGPTLETAKRSYGKGDFAHSYLAKEYPVNTWGTDGERPGRSAYTDQAGYFRFEGNNKIYNLYDAGNHMWGSWMRLNNYSEGAALKGANWNEFGRDTPADQRAIYNGYNYGR